MEKIIIFKDDYGSDTETKDEPPDEFLQEEDILGPDEDLSQVKWVYQMGNKELDTPKWQFHSSFIGP